MKTIFYLLFSLLLLSCNDDDKTENPIDQLPPLTTTGENTFGCLIDGRAFTPQGGGLGGPDRGASYQFIYNDGESYYNFQVFGRNFRDNIGIYINIQLHNLDDLQQGQTYILGEIGTDDGGGGYSAPDLEAYDTDANHKGQLIINHYNYDNRIISGTFEFEVEVDGEIVKITDGRFDMKFTI